MDSLISELVKSSALSEAFMMTPHVNRNISHSKLHLQPAMDLVGKVAVVLFSLEVRVLLRSRGAFAAIIARGHVE